MLAVLAWFFGKATRAPLEGSGAPPILQLEIATTKEKADAFINTWKAACPENTAKPEEAWNARLLNSIRWDTWFILTYAPLLALLCWKAADEFASVMPWAAVAGRMLAWAQIYAGALDFVENAGMWRLINEGVSAETWCPIPAYASWLKWILIGCFVAFVLAALVHRLVFRRRAATGRLPQ